MKRIISYNPFFIQLEKIIIITGFWGGGAVPAVRAKSIRKTRKMTMTWRG